MSIHSGAESRREDSDRDQFDRIARQYAKKDLFLSSSLARRSKLLLAMKSILETGGSLGTVVEIGCGVGASSKYLEGCYERYIGLDQSEEMIKAAVQQNEDNPRAEFVARNIKSQDLPSDVADVILSVGALHHMTDLDTVMDSLARIAKPGALLVTIEPHSANPLIQVMRRLRGVLDSGYSQGQVFFRESDLTQLFADHGIVDLSLEFHGFLSPPFAEVVLHPQFITSRLSRAAVSIDSWIHEHGSAWWKRFGFNIVITGRFAK